MVNLPKPATEPTMYFIGVTTGQSSIMRIFPIWAKVLGIQATLKGIDIAIHAPAEDYRAVMEFIRSDPLSMGALVTTHKIDLLNACRDLFDELDPYAQRFGEISSISKWEGKMRGHAKDPISAGLALDSFLPAEYWREHPQAQACVLGAGGSALAVCAYLAHEKHGDAVPARIQMNNRSVQRLAEAVHLLGDSRVQMSFNLCPVPEWNDRIVESLPEGSLIINATGMGKDRPGSPVTDRCRFPKNSVIWEFNYRGSLEFMHQAEAQQEASGLRIENGWTYFIHGWTQVIAEVFHIAISGDRLAMCDQLAR